jgi:hypothetical protein
MKHTRTISKSVQRAATNNLASYLILIGQILGILAPLFANKELFPSETEGEGE